MKNYYLLLLFALFTPSLAAQMEWTSRPGFTSLVNTIESLPDGSTVVGGQFQNDIFYERQPYIALFNPDHTLAWEFTDFEVVGGRIMVIVPLPDGSFYVLGEVGYCDTVGGGLLYHFDANGQVLYQTPEDNYYLDAKGAMLLSNQHLLVYDSYHIQRIGLQYEILWTYTPNLDLFSSINVMANSSDQLYWLCTDEPDDDDCSIFGVEYYPLFTFFETCTYTNRPVRKLITNGDREGFLLQKNQVHLGNINGNLLQSSPLFPNANFVQFRADSSSLWLLSDTPDSSAIFQVSRDSLKLLSVTDLKLNNYQKAVDFTLGIDGQLLVTGQNESLYRIDRGWPFIPASGNSIFLRSYTPAQSTSYPDIDAAVLNIELSNSPLSQRSDCDDHPYCMEETWDVEVPGLQVTIQNTGNEVIHTIDLNGDYAYNCNSCVRICNATQTFFKRFTGLDIAPGQSRELFFGNLEILNQNLDDENLEICFWTSDPNSHIDKSPENDLLCKMIEFSVGITAAEEFYFQINYHPGLQTLEIKGQQVPNLKQIRLFDILGREVPVTINDQSDQVIHLSLDAANYPQQVYVLHLSYGQQQQSYKFVNY